MKSKDRDLDHKRVTRLQAITKITLMRGKLAKETKGFVKNMRQIAESKPPANNKNAAKVREHAAGIIWMQENGPIGRQLRNSGEKERTGPEINE